jgi:energy-coupling factor transport system permease protein
VPTLRTDRTIPRSLHPGAWWVWAIGLATVASRTRNPLLLLLVLSVAGYVVSARRSDAPWARAFVVFLKLGLIVIAIRTIAQVVLATPIQGAVLFTLPELPLPEWAAGVTVGGEVTAPSVAAAITEGLRLATVLACIGAANALANPKRLLKTLPAALYEIGVALVVALSFAPSLVTSVQRIRAARRLRGRPDRGIRGMVSVAMPVLEDALERSLALAAAMDSRGYGRRTEVGVHTRRVTAVLTLGGLLGVALGMYGLLDASGPALLGLPTLLAGLLTAAVGLVVAGRRTVRSRYRPDPWRLPEWITAGTGLAAAAASITTGFVAPDDLAPSLLPLTDLPLPALATVGLLLAALPALATPRTPDTVRSPATSTSRQRSTTSTATPTTSSATSSSATTPTADDHVRETPGPRPTVATTASPNLTAGDAAEEGTR